jgi:hypothetical protein
MERTSPFKRRFFNSYCFAVLCENVSLDVRIRGGHIMNASTWATLARDLPSCVSWTMCAQDSDRKNESGSLQAGMGELSRVCVVLRSTRSQ